jgi:hypothetical protein
VDGTLQPKEASLGILLAFADVVENWFHQSALLIPVPRTLIGTFDNHGTLLAKKLGDLSPAPFC